MNIQVTDSWLREHLETRAKPEKIAECLSLCGPSVEKVERVGKDWVYDIEVTTNRVDMMSVRGIAREATAILPQFGIKAQLKPLKTAALGRVKEGPSLEIRVDKKLTRRVNGIILEGITNWESPKWMVERLKAAGVRSLGAPVDITNYVMLEMGHPTHIFDYDLIKTKKFIIRAAKAGEKIVSLENKEYALTGGDIVIDDGTERIIDLPGIIGTENSVAKKTTKRFLFFSESNDPVRIRRSSMSLGIRTMAATINEKAPDPELMKEAMLRGVELYQKICRAKVASEFYDVYPIKVRSKTVKAELGKIMALLGVELTKAQVGKMLAPLGFEVKWKGNLAQVKVPSWRINDMEIAEDVCEEVARIYGYHKLPSQLMAGALPEKIADDKFEIEAQAKQIAKELGGVEVYTSSLVSQKMAGKGALALKNPLGRDTSYLRTSLLPSLLAVAKENAARAEKQFEFEIANVYLPTKDNNLPEERQTFAGIFGGYKYRDAKGVVEALMEQLSIVYLTKEGEDVRFETGQALEFWAKKVFLGVFGKVSGKDFYYFEFEMDKLRGVRQLARKYQSIPKYPPQIEDLTFIFPERTKIGEVMKAIQSIKLVRSTELMKIYRHAYTLRVWYQHPRRTLGNQEVAAAREKIKMRLEQEFGGRFKG